MLVLQAQLDHQETMDRREILVIKDYQDLLVHPAIRVLRDLLVQQELDNRVLLVSQVLLEILDHLVKQVVQVYLDLQDLPVQLDQLEVKDKQVRMVIKDRVVLQDRQVPVVNKDL